MQNGNTNGYTASGKTVLIVYAHWERHSYNGALLDAAVTSLQKAGHKVIVSDLYAMNWNPVCGKHDIAGPPANADHFSWPLETTKAYEEGRLAPEIVEEQRKVDEADLIIFQFPFTWSSFPAIMKGWIDRVFTHKYAFEVPDKLFTDAHMVGKKVLLSFTQGSSQSQYTGHSQMGDINIALWPIQNNIFRFMGFDVLPPQIVYFMDANTYEYRQAKITEWGQRLKNVFDEPVLKLLNNNDFEAIDKSNPAKGDKVKDGVADSVKDSSYGLTVGQHLGKPIPPDSQIKPFC